MRSHDSGSVRSSVEEPRWRRVALAGLPLVFFAACAGGPAQAPGIDDITRPEVTAFVGVNVVPMDSNRVLEDQTVVVNGGRIVALGPSADTDVPFGGRRVDGQGLYLMPGLAEMHGHLPNPQMPVEVTENVLFLYIANGVTTIRGMQGNASQLALRERIENGELPGPTLYLGSPSMNGGNVTSVDDAERLVREYDEVGFDLLKVHEGLTPEVYDTIASTARELGMPFGGHVSDHVGLFHALESGQATVDHLDNCIEALVPEDAKPSEAPGLRGVGRLVDLVDEARIPQVVEALKAADAVIVPTMVLWESGLYPTRRSIALREQRPEIQYMPSETVEQWSKAVDDAIDTGDPAANQRVGELRRRLLRVFHEEGVRILLGTDSPQIFSVPGFSIHREMRAYANAGMLPFEVLAAGTRLVAEHLGAEEDFGTVAVGQRADLILLQRNPLVDVANVELREGVMVNGRWITEGEIQARLAEIAEYYASANAS